MMLFFQHNDPNHMHEYLYWFLLLTPILLVFLIFVGYKLMKFLDKRQGSKHKKKLEKRNKNKQ